MTTKVQRLTLEPERHVGTPTWELFSHFRDMLPQTCEPDDFKQLWQLLEGTCQFEFLAVRRRIKQNFQTFSLAARGKQLPKRKGARDPSDKELDEGELCFMEDLVDLLEASHFKLLSADDWNTAQAEEFTFTMPVEVNWANMDTHLMNRFWDTRPPEEKENIADMSDRVLVYHRGITSMKARGKFINDKIDLLVSYLIVHPFLRLYDRLPDKVKDVVPKMSVDVEEHVQDQGLPEFHNRTPSASQHGVYGPHGSLPSQHSMAKEVNRITLKSLMPNAGAVFSKLFSTLEIEEPGFKNVVVLYRRVIPDDPTPKNEKSPVKEYDARLAKRNIHVKRFDDIPMADTEMIFPDKRVYVKPIVLIQLLVTIILGFVAAFTTFLSMELSMNMLLSILGVAGGRAYQVYYSANIARQQVMDQITEALYEQSMDAQEGVIYFLLDQMADQHVKEAAVAYFVLLFSGKSMTHRELDDECEAYLMNSFNERVDFAIERSLPELLEDGLVTEDDKGVLTATPLHKSRELLKEKWASFSQMQSHQTVIENVFTHHTTRRTTTTTTETTDISETSREPEEEQFAVAPSRIKRLSIENRARRSASLRNIPSPTRVQNDSSDASGRTNPADSGVSSGSVLHVAGAPLGKASGPSVHESPSTPEVSKKSHHGILGMFKPSHKKDA
ncbi:hypothetical protein WJX73_000179 [Symbiochloris irregularis]|uniref:Uncharacterized protein n=1 Tax=Symbiochloris irregularis TaxID=706552 RepID=A0AAW1PN97_9CHLO